MKYIDTCITNLKDYLGWIKDVHVLHATSEKGQDIQTYQSIVYFRGQASETWELKASIFREKLDEYELLKKAQLKIWNELTKYESFLGAAGISCVSLS